MVLFHLARAMLRNITRLFVDGAFIRRLRVVLLKHLRHDQVELFARRSSRLVTRNLTRLRTRIRTSRITTGRNILTTNRLRRTSRARRRPRRHRDSRYKGTRGRPNPRLRHRFRQGSLANYATYIYNATSGHQYLTF